MKRLAWIHGCGAALSVVLVAVALVAVALLGAGCTDNGGVAGEDDTPDNIEGKLDPSGPVHIDGFASETIGKAESPVAAVTADGTIYIAYLDGDTQQPMLGKLGGPAAPIDGDWAGTNALAMIAAVDGSLHVVGDPVGRIQHVRRYPGGGFSTPAVLVEADARDATIARTAGGDIVVAYTADSALSVAAIYVHRGQVGSDDVVFGNAEHANRDCCVDKGGDAAYSVSGASLAVGPDGTVHLVYEWTTSSSTTVEYINDRGGSYTSVAIITEVASIPCPALVVDERGAHITYVNVDQAAAWYVNVTAEGVGEPIAIYEGDWYSVHMALMNKDGDGGMHIGVAARTEAGPELMYVYLAPDGTVGAPMTAIVSESGVQLTPRAGGSVLAANGTLTFAYTSGGEGALAIGSDD